MGLRTLQRRVPRSGLGTHGRGEQVTVAWRGPVPPLDALSLTLFYVATRVPPSFMQAVSSEIERLWLPAGEKTPSGHREVLETATLVPHRRKNPLHDAGGTSPPTGAAFLLAPATMC